MKPLVHVQRRLPQPTDLPLLLACLLWLLGSAPAQAFSACAGSPDGSVCVVGGTTRAIIVYKTSDWTVQKRSWLGARIRKIAFTPDGAQCVVLGDDNVVRAYGADDWEQVKAVQNISYIAIAGKAPIAVGVSRVLKGGWRDQGLIVWSTNNWAEGKRITLPKKRSVSQIAVSDDGKTAYVRTIPYQAPDEKGAARRTGLQSGGLRRLSYQETDGWATDFYVVDLEKGRISDTVVCFDNPGVHEILPTSKGALSVCRNYWGVVSAETGEYSIKACQGSAGASGRGRDGNIYTGSSREFVVLSPDGEELAKERVRRLPGSREYFTDFAPLGSDRMIAVTDGFRIIVIDTESHRVLKELAYY